MMNNIELPKGFKHKIEKSNPGIVIPGSDKEPIITIVGCGSKIQYRLISYALNQIDAISWEGDVSQEALDDIDSWVSYYLPSLLKKANVRHLVYFSPNSKCYYDFISQTLYGADGIKEKKGEVTEFRQNTAYINGEPYVPNGTEIAFIEVLTETPDTPYDTGRFLREDDNLKSPARLLNEYWHRFKRLDSSIDEKFDRKNGKFIYTGNPQIWVIEGEVEGINLTFEKIFKAVVYRDIVATFDKESRQLRTSLVTEISQKEMIVFLGLDKELLNTESMDINRFVSDNYCDSIDELKFLLERYYNSLEAVWNRLKSNIIDSFSYSLRASSFYDDTDEMPFKLTDLKGYSDTSERFNNSLKRICPAIKGIIQNTKIGTDFFAYCNIEVIPEKEKAIDYIVALVLACLSNCRTASTDKELIRLRRNYQSKLQVLIHQKFDYDPPGGGKDSSIEEILRRDLQALQAQAIADGLDYYASAIDKIFDSLNLGYNDENSLLPPSMGRNL